MPTTDPYRERRARLLALRDEVALALDNDPDPEHADQLRSRLQDLDGVLRRLSEHLREPDSVPPGYT
ncbi:hypothetical protein A8924_5379 [Saccharopolyspora erythraea NRRL 2338]|uniref:Uncharacterized protein n=2 Tax=Saccharopolyspora erythraea TaxID=1836 RepID=A4FJN6_SACEN|nr:hypothetical protein [Saccharopolyspora erythraea]EQD86091.1 hypothetical protein N599_11570 [Saccharopolyspora erythraea D]PFG97905.1 hypothetical protein A8924_5379 [Saccharopolyspora erythraea NRRL 2338]QRK88041.1 hypothetical protein JQX30_25350 [Saccharopolyspora erythraea]CAM04261.1 hypothetical protein SACE_4997 [Saccharopolyspora erythraea NRRL 2338]